MAEKALIDTSVLIAYYNERQFEDRFLELNRRSHLLFSVVTVNELIRGAHDVETRRIAKDFLSEASGSLITPSEKQWIECARISEEILRRKRRSKEKVLLLQNDILIALGARDAEALLVTADQNDFGLLSHFIKIPIDYW